MREFEFRLVVSANDDDYDQVEASLVQAGMDDGYLGATGGVVFVDFAREADSMTDAVLSAIHDVRSAGIAVQRVDSDELVTAAEIARRTGRTRESIRLLACGDRGAGGFPAPVRKRQRSKHWRWSEVAPWLEEAGILEGGGHAEEAKAIAAVNGALELVRNTASAKRRYAIVKALQTS